MKILITGATGLVGRAVGRELAQQGHEIVVTSRRRSVELPFPHTLIRGDLSECCLPALAEQGIQAIYHLMGETVAQRWTPVVKKKLRQSRIQSIANLKQSLGESWSRVEVFVGTSAVGYYGNAGEKVVTEAGAAGHGFLAELCRDWESAQLSLQSLNPRMRIAILRVGMVLAAEGGALQKMLPAFLAHVGGSIGNGEQWQSWIHLKDLERLYVAALGSDKYSGVFNAVAPEPVKNKRFTLELERTLGVMAITPIPAHVLEWVMGEMSEMLIDSQRVFPQRALDAGFCFEYSHLGSALQDLVGYHRWGEREVNREYYCEGEDVNEVFLRLVHQRKNSGELCDYQIKLGGVSFHFQSVLEEVLLPTKFIEVQLRGPYRSWRRIVNLRELGGGVYVQERIRYQCPLSWVSNWVGGPQFVERHLKQV